MSNFSNIGFPVQSQEDYRNLLEKAYRAGQAIPVAQGRYVRYAEASGIELWLQFNLKNELIGVNPHFKGKSRRKVCLTKALDRPESELDGAFHGWADPAEANNPDSGAYPFVFDLPDFKTIGPITFPCDVTIQLTAFAQDMQVFEDEDAYDNNQTREMKFAVESFIPSGLFTTEGQPPAAQGMFTGSIKAFEQISNQMSGEVFYWLLVQTLGGPIDVVADMRYFRSAPLINGVVQGQFWLSGQLIDPPAAPVPEKKGFFGKLFGN